MTGADILQKARTRLGDSYLFGALTPVGAPDPRVFDCSKLASWAVYQAAQIIYGADHDAGNPLEVYGGTIYWNRDARSAGSIVSLEEAAASPGAAVLRLATASLCGHIVLSDGLGGTVEAHSTAAGVIASTLHGRRWDLGILVPGIEYQRQKGRSRLRLQPNPFTASPIPSCAARWCSASRRPLSVTGLWPVGLWWRMGFMDPETEHAVAAFQRSQGSLVARRRGWPGHA